MFGLCFMYVFRASPPYLDNDNLNYVPTPCTILNELHRRVFSVGTTRINITRWGEFIGAASQGPPSLARQSAGTDRTHNLAGKPHWFSTWGQEFKRRKQLVAWPLFRRFITQRTLTWFIR